MKIILCSDVRLGAVCTENLDVKLSHKWQAARTEKIADLIDQAAQNNVTYAFLTHPIGITPLPSVPHVFSCGFFLFSAYQTLGALSTSPA